MSKTKIIKSGEHRIIVDAEFFPFLSRFTWHTKPDNKGMNIYAKTSGRFRGKQIIISMHQLITNFSGRIVDHINGNGLDNRLCNIRLCTIADNAKNRKPLLRKTTSKFKGVCWHKVQKNWRVSINVNGHKKWIGSFNSERMAAKAYDNAARRFHGEFARTNFKA